MVSLFQSLLWMVFASVLILLFRRKLDWLIHALIAQIQKGAPLSVGGFFNLGEPPASLKEGAEGAVTTEGKQGIKTSTEIQDVLMRKAYPEGIDEKVYLVHAAEVLVPRTIPASGRYRVRVWLEAYDQSLLDEIDTVTYRLYDDFSPNTISTSARYKNFELWLNVYGEFTLIGSISRKGGKPTLWVTRYLDLPGRPPE